MQKKKKVTELHLGILHVASSNDVWDEFSQWWWLFVFLSLYDLNYIKMCSQTLIEVKPVLALNCKWKCKLVWACLAQTQFSDRVCRDMRDYRRMWKRWKFKEKLRERKQQEAIMLLSAQREYDDLWWQLAVSEAGDLFMNITEITVILTFINHHYTHYYTSKTTWKQTLRLFTFLMSLVVHDLSCPTGGENVIQPVLVFSFKYLNLIGQLWDCLQLNICV